MKKGLLLVAILLLAGAGVAGFFAADNFSSAAREASLMDKTMAEMQGTQDMAKLQSLRDDMDIYSAGYRKYRDTAMMGLGGGAILLVGGIVSLVMSRRPKS